jgi:peptidoglycan hydrolase CwlO-like protein
MNDIGTLASIVAAITGIVAMITGIIAIRNSKGNVIKRIERKQRKIQEIDNQFARTYGLNANANMHYPTSSKINTLQKDIEELKKRI